MRIIFVQLVDTSWISSHGMMIHRHLMSYDDYANGKTEERKLVYTKWRKKWIENGMKWFSRGRKKPENWDPVAQLTNIE